MLSEDLKDRIKRHVTEDFETSTTDSDEVSDGLVDSISAGLDVFEADLNVMSDEDKDLFYEFVDETLTDLIEQWEEEQEEEDE